MQVEIKMVEDVFERGTLLTSTDDDKSNSEFTVSPTSINSLKKHEFGNIQILQVNKLFYWNSKNIQQC